MRYLFLALLSIITAISTSAQTQSDHKTCRFGITFAISENPCWGYNEPVVLTVEPHSPAANAGIKVNDIIMEINGTATYLRSYEIIYNWLFDSGQEDAVFTIRNLDTYFKDYKLLNLCKNANAMTESDLASAFSFYSIENTRDIAFEIPLKVTSNKDVDFSDYQSYDFVKQENAPAIDLQIQSELEKSLKGKGLIRNTEDPDCIIQTYYSYQPNERYSSKDAGQIADGNKQSLRYDLDNSMMLTLPILSPSETSAETKASYAVQFGIRIFDKKHINPKKLTQIWDCNVKEYLTSALDLGEYARVYMPLFLKQFPYATDRRIAKYVVSYKKYNYTGLNFDSNNISKITDVDINSPAYIVGIRPGDEIISINKIPFNYSKDEMNDGYKRFIGETMVLRNPDTRFTDAKGFPDCMFWSKANYEKIANAFKKSIYTTGFSYLYYFNKYVSGKSDESKTISIELKSRTIGGKEQRRTLKVEPELRTSVVVRAL